MPSCQKRKKTNNVNPIRNLRGRDCSIVAGIEDRIIRVPNKVVLAAFDDDGELCGLSESFNSRTQIGGQVAGNILFGTSAQPAAFNYCALSSNSSFSPVYTDTTLSTEIVTVGLGRKQGVFTQPVLVNITSFNATGATTMVTTWSAITGPMTVYGAGLLNAVSTGTLGFEAATATTVVASGYTLVLTWTLNE